MPSSILHFVIRTPQAIVFDADVRSIRVPTESGQVGLRPRCEPSVLAVEPGLIVIRQDGASRFAGTAGGLLRCDGIQASLLTPVAVVGNELASVLKELDRTLAAPSTEQEVRAMLGRLEKNILQEVQRGGESHLGPTGKVP